MELPSFKWCIEQKKAVIQRKIVHTLTELLMHNLSIEESINLLKEKHTLTPDEEIDWYLWCNRLKGV